MSRIYTAVLFISLAMTIPSVGASAASPKKGWTPKIITQLNAKCVNSSLQQVRSTLPLDNKTLLYNATRKTRDTCNCAVSAIVTKWTPEELRQLTKQQMAQHMDSVFDSSACKIPGKS